MGTMRNFWMLERRLQYIADRHDTNDFRRIIDIAKTSGYLVQIEKLTEHGKPLAPEKFKRDQSSHVHQTGAVAGT